MIEQDRLALRVARIQAAATVLAAYYRSRDMGGQPSEYPPVMAAMKVLAREFKEHLDETDSAHPDPAPGTAGRDSE